MKAELNVTGLGQVFALLKSVAEKVPDKARKTMRRGAAKIVKEAKLNTPEDTQALMKSIDWTATYESKGRLQIEIKVGGWVDGYNVDEYAARIHESYDPQHAGERTQAKMAAYPDRIIGAKFLERAIQDQEKKLEADLIVAIRQEIQGEY